MKSALSLTLPFLLFALTTNLASAAFKDPPVKILDSKGAPLSPSAEYYITQLNNGPTGGGLKTGTGLNITCPLIVLQDFYNAIRGQKVRFTIRGRKSDTIMTGTPLDIEFVDDKPSCASSSKWVVVYEKKYPAPWVGIGDPARLPGKRVIDGVFRIEKYLFLEGYKFMFCPTGSTRCANVGRREDANGKRLILTNQTGDFFVFEVGFERAVKPNSSKLLF